MLSVLNILLHIDGEYRYDDMLINDNAHADVKPAKSQSNKSESTAFCNTKKSKKIHVNII